MYVLFRVISVNIHGPNGILRVLALCDEGSTVTLVEDESASQLVLTGPSETLRIQWTNDSVSRQEDSKGINVDISAARENSKIFSIKGVHTVENSSFPSQTIDLSLGREHEHLQNVPIDSFFKENPSIDQGNINLLVPVKT
ncbi:hypothetical protein JTB14_022826 [Gonioctena quinquepunctata]|nr:hypothetical protein JTB14_022826 [Gonioctena quinquepunctata]